MSSQDMNFIVPEIDYQAEELSKRLRFSMANFAQVRFLSEFKKRMNNTRLE